METRMIDALHSMKARQTVIDVGWQLSHGGCSKVDRPRFLDVTNILATTSARLATRPTATPEHDGVPIQPPDLGSQV